MAELGFADAPDLAMTSATVGILAGVFGGLIFIKWATAKGYTQYIKNFAYLSGDLKTGMVSRETRRRWEGIRFPQLPWIPCAGI